MRLNLNISTIHGRRNVFLKENANGEKERERGTLDQQIASDIQSAIRGMENVAFNSRRPRLASLARSHRRGKSRLRISSRCRGAQSQPYFLVKERFNEKRN